MKGLGTTRKTERSRRSSARSLRAPVTQMRSNTLGKTATDAVTWMPWSKKQGTHFNVTQLHDSTSTCLRIPHVHTYESRNTVLRNKAGAARTGLGALPLHRRLFKDVNI